MHREGRLNWSLVIWFHTDLPSLVFPLTDLSSFDHSPGEVENKDLNGLVDTVSMEMSAKIFHST